MGEYHNIRLKFARLTHNSPKYLERNLAQEKTKGFFPMKYAILSYGKCPNNLISGFQGVIFFELWQY